MLRHAFETARDKAAADNPDIEKEMRNFQFRDLRAKAATDMDDVDGITVAQAQLGHATTAMTARHVRHRQGKLVKPTKQVPETFCGTKPVLRNWEKPENSIRYFYQLHVCWYGAGIENR